MKGAGKASSMRWKGPVRNNKSPISLFTVKKGQKTSVEARLSVTPSILSYHKWGGLPGPLPALSFLLETSFAFFIAPMLPARAELRYACGKRWSPRHRPPSLRKHGWHWAPGAAAFALFPFRKKSLGGEQLALRSSGNLTPSPAQEGAGRHEMAMKHLQACVGLAHGWETAMEGATVEDGAVQREGRLPLSSASASLSWKIFFKIISHEQ